jgi:hypothetical protein
MVSLTNQREKAKLNFCLYTPMGFRPIYRAILSVFFCLTQSGCIYKFSNKDLKTPEGVRTVAVEAVFDTSREVVHHEHLWSELQKAFASDGHLRVVPVGKADALVRAHLKKVTLSPSGETFENGVEKDPAVFNRGDPSPPNQFKVLTQAWRVRNKMTLSTVVDVEVWNLWTKTLIMRRTYSLADTLQAIHATNNITTKGNDFLRLEESSDARFHEVAKKVANQVVRDLFIN